MKILFILLSALTGFFIGVLYSSLTLSEGSGLAGPAIVLGGGVIGGIILLIISLFLIKKFNRGLLKKITIVLLVLNLIPIGWMVYRFMTNRSMEETAPKREIVPPKATESSLFSLPQFSKNNPQPVVGMGMARPDFFNKKVLYFYSPNPEKSASDHVPTDSLVFSRTEIGYDISYAPPWFYPEHLKMDYEILYLKILTLGRDWIEVEVNRQTNLSSWVSASDVKVLLWPEFLLNVFSIENLDQQNNPLRIKPLSHASEFIGKKYTILSPVLIKENWIKVELFDDDYNKAGEAWLKWYDNGKLLISWSLLS